MVRSVISLRDLRASVVNLFPHKQNRHRLTFIALVVAVIAAFQLPAFFDRRPGIAMGADATTAASSAKLVPGLMVSFQNATGETVDARDARLIALMVPVGTPASPLLAPGEFGVTWTGIVTTKIKDTYRFAAEGSGDLSVTMNDKLLLDLHGDFAGHVTEPVLLKKGKNRLLVKYHSGARNAGVNKPGENKSGPNQASAKQTSENQASTKKLSENQAGANQPGAGDAASIRLLWAASGKTLEPISPAVFTHDASDDLLIKHSAVRVGRELLATMRCAACHQGTEGAMPELKQDAPNLTALKTRLNATWAAYWISNPKALRPTASMPRVFHDAPATADLSVDDRAGDIAAYLTDGDSPATLPSDPSVLAKGARLFTGLGCVACHVAPGVTDSDSTLHRVPLKYVRAKFKPGALLSFLHQPEAHYAWIRMPNFHLSDAEANALAAWLLSSCAPDALPVVAKKFDPENGKKLFATSGCLNCHATESSKPNAPTVAELSILQSKGPMTGCLADDVSHVGKGVDFQLTPDERQLISAFLSGDWKPALQRDPQAEFTTRQMTALRCTACHSADGQDNSWSTLDSEISSMEQALPPRPDNDPEPKGDQSRPPLTWTGEKLQPTWMTDFISGKIAYKPRPWLFARMPSFASRAALLSQGLALSHGCPAVDETRPAVDEAQVEIGKQLTSQTGLGCVKCHAVGEQAALAPFEAEAPNLAHAEARLRHYYFTRWMLNPNYYLPGTKMPSFADVNGQTPLKEILDGNAAAEFQAVWNYLRAGEKIIPAQ